MKPSPTALLGILAVACLGTLWAADEQAAEVSPAAVVRQSRQLIADGEVQQAADLLEAEVKKHPMDPDLRTNLGYAYELLGRGEDALEQYAAIVALAPGNIYAADRLARLLYGRQFPTRLLNDQLSLLPVQFARFVIRRPDGRDVVAACNVSVLYPGEMRATGQPISKTIPPGVSTGDVCEFNRVIYTFVGVPGDPYLWQCSQVYYPSSLLSREGRDYGLLAASLARMLARFEAYLGLIAKPTKDVGPVRVWLCEAGPAGGETDGQDIYLYQVSGLRPGEEWEREPAHELSHARFPTLGSYREPEDSLAGAFGEAWLLAALAYEAEQATGQAWTTPAAQQWISGLWPAGSVDLAQLMAKSVAASVRTWQIQGPYPSDATSAEAARMACGLLLWVQAAHGSSALRIVLGAESGSLAALIARYSTWLEEGRSKIVFNASAGWCDEGPPDTWLPFDNASVTASREKPWRTKCFLPGGAWRVIANNGGAVTARWQPVQTEETEPPRWGTQVSSRGEWGVLEVAVTGDSPTSFSSLTLQLAPEA